MTTTSVRNLRNIDWENGPDRKLAHNTYRVTVDGKSAIKLHNTVIVVLQGPGRMTLHTGGYWTSTTKQRINQFLPNAWTLFSDRGTWKLLVRMGEGRYIDFKYVDGITIDNMTKTVEV